MKYRIYLINFGWYSQHEFNNFEDALNKAKDMSYESRIEYGNSDMFCASWSPVSGTQYFQEYRDYCKERGVSL